VLSISIRIAYVVLIMIHTELQHFLFFMAEVEGMSYGYLCVVYLMTLAVAPDCMVSCCKVINHSCGTKQLWPDLRYRLGICKERLRKNMKSLS
jgi:hypothetical protein